MAFSPENKTAVGSKGSDVYTLSGVGDPRVALSALLVRNADTNLIDKCMREILEMDDEKAFEDLFVLVFQTRDVRGGKGERALSEAMMRFLFSQVNTLDAMLSLLDLVPEYGSWRDLFALCERSIALSKTDPHSLKLLERVYSLTKKQLEEDETAMSQGKSVSLLAKWIPREGRQERQAKYIASLLYPREERPSRRLAAYRKRIVALNVALKTVEVKMCGGDWASIKPGEVPGRALKKYTKAFLNETLSKRKGEHTLRCPDNEDRMFCRENFQKHFDKAAKGEAKLNGANTIFPHELIKKISDCRFKMSEEEKNSIRSIWRGMVQKAKEGGGLGRSLAMCDFSGSMQNSCLNGDEPYWVSMALGLLISEVTTEEFKDTFLTFDSNPKLHKLPATEDIFARVDAIGSSLGQGLSTDFQKAMDLVLARLKEKRCRPGQEPENLIVLTDMNWDAACASNQKSGYTGNSYRHVVKTDLWQTHVEMIREAFKRAGEDMWGSEADGGLGGWKMPTIVIWNIAATSADFHAKADTEGVAMLSGWSPSLFKVLQSEGVVTWTPYQALRIQLDDERYEPIRKRVRRWLQDEGTCPL
jgi:hypothetical protein